MKRKNVKKINRQILIEIDLFLIIMVKHQIHQRKDHTNLFKNIKFLINIKVE